MALAQHPVLSYVKHLLVDSSLYPAIEYLKSGNQESTQEDPKEMLFRKRPEDTPESRQAVIDYVFTHPDNFLSLDDDTPDSEFNEWARKKNAGASFSFLTDFRRKYLVKNR